MILTILKIIGIILLVILLIVVALLMLVLLWPVSYQGDAEAHEGIKKADVSVSWLLKALCFRLSYDETREQKLIKGISIFGIPLEKIKALLSRKKDPEKEKEARKKKLKKLKETDPETYEKLREEAKERRRLERERLKAEEEAEKAEEARKQAALKKKKAKPAKRAAFSARRVLNAVRRAERHAGVYFLEFVEDLLTLPGMIIHKVREISRNVRTIFATVRRWARYLFDPSFMRMLRKVLWRVKKLLWHMRPRRVQGKITFGMEDPYQTGIILAGADSVYPLWSRSLVLIPDFGNKILEGDVAFKGRLFLGYVLYQGVRVLLDKDVKRAIKFLKQEKERTNGG